MSASDPTPAEEAAQLDAEHDAHVDRLRGELQENLSLAVNHLQLAANKIRQLNSNAVYDIEFAEGAAGTDVEALLSDAGRLTRAAECVTAQTISAST